MRKSLLRRLTGLFVLAATFSLSGASAEAQVKVYRGKGAEAASQQHSRRPANHLFKHRDFSGLNTLGVSTSPVTAKSFAPRGVAQAAPSRVTLAGYVTGQGNLQNGIYSFDVGPTPELSLLFHDDAARFAVDGGGTYYDGKYYYIEWHYGLMSDEIYAHYGVQDTETWTELYRSSMDQNPIDEHSIAMDLAYCPVDNTIYGVFEDYEVIPDAYTYYFGKLNQYGEREGIAQLDKRYWAVAADARGNIFGIDEDGWLCSFDRQTGAVKRIGDTGIDPYYMQSATCDFRTNQMYWVASGKSILTALYTVDTATGAVTKVCNIPGDEQIAGLYVVDHSYADEAPFKPTDLTAVFDRGSLTGKVNFTMPAVSYAGTALSGSLNYTVTLNGVEAATGTAAAGAAVSADVTAPQPGNYEVVVSAANAAGDGPSVKTSLWIGDDLPTAPQNVTASKNDNKVTVTWSAPTATSHGGFLNQAALRYKVTRFPDMKVLADDLAATTVVDTNLGVPVKSYWYEVRALSGSQQGGAATSNNLVFGTHYEIPYFEDFANDLSWPMFTTIDVEDDGKEWLYYSDKQAVGCMASQRTDVSDDWLITPPIYLTANRSYILAFDAASTSNTMSEAFEVAIGTTATVNGMGRIIMPRTEVKSSAFVTFEQEFSVPSDGLYYIGFHDVSPKYRNWLYLDNLTIIPGKNLNAPAAVTDLTVTPAANGRLAATVNFTAPAKTADGGSLSAITRIDLYRGQTVINTFENPAPGSALSFEDVKAQQGVNEYTVVSYNGTDAGEPATASAWVGVDIPKAVENVKAVENADGSFTITWDPVTEGANGGFIDPTQICYFVARSTDSDTFADQLFATTVTDKPAITQHTTMAYLVVAVSQGGQSEWAISNIVVVGTPHELPYAESFAAMALQAGPWAAIVSEGDAEWEMKQGGFKPFTQGVQDADGGMIAFVPAAAGDKGALYSGKFNISNVVNPTLSFWYYNNPGNNGAIELLVSKNGGDFESALKIDFATASGAKEWTKAEVPLKQLQADCRHIRFAFEVTAGSDIEIYLDNIRVYDNIDNDLTISAINVPSRLTYQKHALVDVTVKNIGQAASGAYSVNLFRDDALVGTVPVADGLAVDATKTVSFEELPTLDFGAEVTYYAVVDYAADQNTANNRSESVTVKVKQPTFPAVKDLDIRVEGANATLTWSEPTADGSDAEPVTDDFEAYAPFAIDNFGDWMNVDVDGYETYGMQFAKYPNMYDPKAWMVFNPVRGGLSIAYDNGDPNYLAPASGAQYLVAFCSIDPKTEEDMPNDDWLISPELSGMAQTITFKVKRLGMQYAESFEVLASSNSDNMSDFSRVFAGSDIVGFEEWNTVSVPLPAGTKYFAIRCNSHGGFGLMIDDVTYVPASERPVELQLLGYNVYRDNVKVNDAVVTATSYVHPLGDSAEHIYHVTALYDKGESAASNKVSTITGGIEGVETNGYTISTGVGVIAIANAQGSDVRIFAADGRAIYAAPGTDMTLVHVPSGVYLVAVGTATAKVAVR